MISPKEKALYLYGRFLFYTDIDYQDSKVEIYNTKQCALIAIDEILDLNLGFSNCDENNWAIDKFYLEVKQEIEKL
jgi:hypothetical protein